MRQSDDDAAVEVRPTYPIRVIRHVHGMPVKAYKDQAIVMSDGSAKK